MQIPTCLEKHKAGLPAWLVPSAESVYVPTGDQLKVAGSFKGRYRPRGWKLKETEVFRKVIGTHELWVRRTLNRRYPFWTLERVGVNNDDDQMLCYAFGPMPILTKTHQAAMWLAQHCHPNAPNNLGFMHWIDVSA